MSSYIIGMTIIGMAALGMAWMPSISKKIKISYSILYVLFGVITYMTFGNILPLPDPISKNQFTVRLTELVVIISLMGTGLKIDEPFTFKRWAVPLKLVSVTMLLSILIITLIAMYVLHFDLASAILLGAVLAPTDPVLASDVQVGPPMEGEKDNVRFSLTAEAGMNDGTAFPFTWLAIVLATSTSFETIQSWFLVDLIYKIGAGIVVGFLMGRFLAYLVFKVPRNKGLKTRDGFVAISATLLVYGVTEIVHGYGFIAVFVAAIALRNYEMDHNYHRKLHEFTDQTERILVAVVLILFGGSLVTGILKPLTWEAALFAVVFVFLIRPFTSMASMVKSDLHRKEKFAIGFFGIKGMGSFFYLAFALNEVFFALNAELWAIVSFVVLLSITIHGLTATPLLSKLDVELAENKQSKAKRNII